MVPKFSDQRDDVEAKYREVKAWARENCTHDELIHLFAKTRIEADLYKELVNLHNELRDRVERIDEEIQGLVLQQEGQVKRNYEAIAIQATEQGVNIGARIITEAQKTEAHKRGKNAADIRHNKAGGSRSKTDEIRRLWASGKYSSRDLCAEQECGALNMAVGTARKALRNTPKPPSRCSA